MIQQYIAGNILLITSPIFSYEVANSLAIATIRKRINNHESTLLLKDFLKLQIREALIDIQKTFLLAQQKRISAYDASYLYLAQTNNVRLLTLDMRLKNLAG